MRCSAVFRHLANRLCFVIYRENVERSRLRVSSKLMALSAERAKAGEK